MNELETLEQLVEKSTLTVTDFHPDYSDDFKKVTEESIQRSTIESGKALEASYTVIINA